MVGAVGFGEAGVVAAAGVVTAAAGAAGVSLALAGLAYFAGDFLLYAAGAG